MPKTWYQNAQRRTSDYPASPPRQPASRPVIPSNDRRLPANDNRLRDPFIRRTDPRIRPFGGRVPRVTRVPTFVLPQSAAFRIPKLPFSLPIWRIAPWLTIGEALYENWVAEPERPMFTNEWRMYRNCGKGGPFYVDPYNFWFYPASNCLANQAKGAGFTPTTKIHQQQFSRGTVPWRTIIHVDQYTEVSPGNWRARNVIWYDLHQLFSPTVAGQFYKLPGTASLPVEDPFTDPAIWPQVFPEALPINMPAPASRPIPYRVLPRWRPEGLPWNPTERGHQPRSQPRVDPRWNREIEVSQRPNNQPSIRVRPFPRRRPPGPRVRERKAALNVRAAFPVIAAVIGAVTEGLDFANALWRALPARYRESEHSWYHGGRQYTGSNQTGRFRDLYNHWDQIDIGLAVRNLIDEQVEDAAIGRFNRAMNRNSLHRGLGWGPWDSEIAGLPTSAIPQLGGKGD